MLTVALNGHTYYMYISYSSFDSEFLLGGGGWSDDCQINGSKDYIGTFDTFMEYEYEVVSESMLLWHPSNSVEIGKLISFDTHVKIFSLINYIITMIWIVKIILLPRWCKI